MTSYVDNLRLNLDQTKLLMFELLDNSRIRYFRNEPDSQIVFIAPSHYWDKPNEREKQIQIKLKPVYNKWFEAFSIITANSPDDLIKEIDKTDKFIRNWIEKKGNDWGLPGTIQEAKSKFESKIKFFYDTLDLFQKDDCRETILIPDTNSLIQEPEPTKYEKAVDSKTYTIAYLPTVLSELDELKIKSNNLDFQNKVKAVITRLKGYRKQGSMLDGITVNMTITIKMIASEPDFNKSMTWLDPANNDDRIIANAIEIQRDNPSAIVCIVTGDINLQNKAEMANLPYAESPDSE